MWRYKDLNSEYAMNSLHVLPLRMSSYISPVPSSWCLFLQQSFDPYIETYRSGPMGLIRFQVEPAGFVLTKSTWMPFLLANPVFFMLFCLSLPSIARVIHTDWAGNIDILGRLGNTTPSTLFWTCSANSWYLSHLRSCVSSIRSSCGTITRCLVVNSW